MSTYSRLRKNVSISLVLVGLSVIGFLIFQTSWVYNTKETQSHRLLEDIGRAASEVADQLARQKSVQNSLPRPAQPQGLHIPGNGFDLTPPTLVADHFTYNEVAEKLREAMQRHNVGKVKMEFAIFNGNRFIEMNSPNYIKAANLSNLDSTIYRFTVPITTSANLSLFTVDESINIILTDFNREVWRSMTWSLLSFGLFTIVILTAFYLTVRNMLEQEQLSKTKTDFINNMTHEFKTPIATISLAVDAIRSPKVQSNAEKMEYFSGIIKEENKRMNKHVETILQAAKMEKQELNLDIAPMHVHEAISHIADAFTLQLDNKAGAVEQHLAAENDVIYADEMHFNNLINNLIDNAVKYSKPDTPPIVKISTANSAKGIVIRVMDNGIGMSKETIKHIFDRFYRAHTGNVHNVKGFGLGMSYVKQIIEELHGKIKVESTPGKGSMFIIEMPFNIPKSEENNAS